MAANPPAVTASSFQELVNEIKILLWGSAIREDVFHRWTQGFYFSTDENTALVQADGGPCAVIAPLQAFIIKQLLNKHEISGWRDINTAECDQLLIRAMTEIISQTTDEPVNMKFSILLIDKANVLVNGEVAEEQMQVDIEPLILQKTSQASVIKTESEFDYFHSHLRIHTLDSIEKVEKFFIDNIREFKEKFGVLLLLYSVIFTKGISQMQSEISDLSDPLIHATFGHGSQSLINLMLSGRAVNHVWNHDKDIGGLKLSGIEKQNKVGFLTLLETLRYTEVGSFLKSPANPVWVLGSETHLTVLFSFEKKLVSPETPSQRAKRIFKKYDNDGNNFIPTSSLQNVLEELELVSDSEYVEIMKKKLDKHNDGIILQNAFMDEFFLYEPESCPDTFILYHYNGLPRSNPENKVKYHKGQAILLESSVESILDSDSMLTALQTKWPNIEIQWDPPQKPSIY